MYKSNWFTVIYVYFRTHHKITNEKKRYEFIQEFYQLVNKYKDKNNIQ